MSKRLKVFKFGGASVKDAAGFKRVAGILAAYKGAPLVIVVSAIGKTTNALEEVVIAHAKQTGDAFEKLEGIKQEHYALAEFLCGQDQELLTSLNDTFVEIEWVLEEKPEDNYDYMYDQIVSVGELLSTRIVAAYLKKTGLDTAWVDARDMVRTDNIFREGWVEWTETEARVKKVMEPLLEANKMVVCQGFIGSTSENFTTTLGREGSDYSAAIFSYCLEAESMTIWKDVPGVLTADPRKFDNVVKLDALSYREAIEMTYYGAKVIHPKTIKPLQNKNIPLFVKSFLDPDSPGTRISSDVEDHYPPMVAIESNQALVYISTRDFSFVAEHHMSYLFQIIADLRLQVNMMQNTAISFAISVNDVDDKVDRFAETIQEQFQARIERNLELITVRHFNRETLNGLRDGKIVMLEERIQGTVQMVVKKVPALSRKEFPTV
ncbi:MAG: aspartate kinase [Saprospiraceae bacterium]|nr:aspartate kinase [Saprospiraceae bacterium]